MGMDMKKLVSLLLIFIFIVEILTGCSVGNDSVGQGFGEKKYKQFQATYFDLFDTVTTVIGYAQTEEEFKKISIEIYEQLKEYHELFDIYHEYENNNVKTINDRAGKAPVKVDERILELLLDCKKYYEITDGAVNAAMGSILSLWHEARKKAAENPEDASLPSEEDLKEAMKHIAFENVIIDEEKSTVYLIDEKQRLDVGAIAKGWAVERVCQNVPEGFLISVGGNVRTTGPKPDGSAWIIGIQNPEDSNSYIEKVSIAQGSVVTSGDYQRFMDVNGEKYHHLIDPKTAYPAGQWKSVTIICVDSGLADALSTALFVLDKEKGEQILKEQNACAVWIGREKDIIYSDRMKFYLK